MQLSVSDNPLLHCFTLICSNIFIHAAGANRGSVASTSQGARGALSMGLNNACTLPQEVCGFVDARVLEHAAVIFHAKRPLLRLHHAHAMPCIVYMPCRFAHRLHAMQCTHVCESFACHAMPCNVEHEFNRTDALISHRTCLLMRSASSGCWLKNSLYTWTSTTRRSS